MQESGAIRPPIPTKVKTSGVVFLVLVLAGVLGNYAFPEDSGLGTGLFVVGFLFGTCAGVAFLGLLAQHFLVTNDKGPPVALESPQAAPLPVAEQEVGERADLVQLVIGVALLAWIGWSFATSGSNSRIIVAAELQQEFYIESATTSGIGERFLSIKVFGDCGDFPKDLGARLDNMGFYSFECQGRNDSLKESISAFSHFWF